MVINCQIKTGGNKKYLKIEMGFLKGHFIAHWQILCLE